ncbi:family 16 glycosylhydrolase [Urechidicola vernalis]|uniref:Family 16 glycosylhydrolase n=1 Tax=Urechidicola vernalis TaxID=3075600 RepID=A0ABU2Y5F1_9FLAO|nr:family 16 glycosylhydrolase [Urechidicola sp. P050]MDT0553433.1 family 16 glycosylhydrolase [Urechidicola sp. P050]
MKIFSLRYICSFLVMLTFFSCEEDDAIIGDITAATNVVVQAEIVGAYDNFPDGDGSGLVIFTITAEDAITYQINFGDGLKELVPTGKITHRYSGNPGVNTYTVTVNAIGTGGLASTVSISIDVFSSFDNQEVKDLLTGGQGASKTWYLDAEKVGHLGVGPAYAGIDGAWWWPKWYEAQPYEKCNDDASSCFCNDELTFSLDAENQLTYVLDNMGATFFNKAHSGLGGDDVCLDYDSSGTSIVSLAPSSVDWSTVEDPDFESTETVMNFSDDKFMGYYVSSSSYEIISISETEMYVRTIDGLDSALAWYLRYTTTPGSGSEELDVIYTDLVWQDEFEMDGLPDTANWTYDLGAGGWGNNESQFYTDRSNNSKVENGALIITAKREDFGGENFTSARLKSQGLQEFQYGRIDISAKLPEGGGTWPALWMLGANFETVGWPTCGEIDIMEHVGNNPGYVQSAIHTPSSFGNTVNKGGADILNQSSEYHLYSVNWSPNQISFLVDDEIIYTYNPGIKDLATWPFDAPQFLILNIAMGGTLGGTIDPGFVESTMEIDYIRVYQ